MTEQKRTGDLTKEAPFETFCVESQETFTVGQVYIVSGLSYKTVNSGNYLTSYAAWVYTKYRTDAVWRASIDTISDYNWVQNAIWAGMVNSSGVWGGVGSEYWKEYKKTIKMTDIHFVTLHISNSDFLNSNWSGFGDVKIANLVGKKSNGCSTNAQDQLVWNYIPKPPNVPEPMSIVIWTILLICLTGSTFGKRH